MLLFQTLTGFTGVLLYITVAVIFIFTIPKIRKKAYNFFWLTHQLYMILFFLSILHSLAHHPQDALHGAGHTRDRAAPQ